MPSNSARGKQQMRKGTLQTGLEGVLNWPGLAGQN